jgi:hypothetical protein
MITNIKKILPKNTKGRINPSSNDIEKEPYQKFNANVDIIYKYLRTIRKKNSTYNFNIY